MDKLETEVTKSHWRHSDNFGAGEREYIKSFVHHDYSIGMHTHDFYELNIVFGGCGRHYIESSSCPAEVGCVFIIPPNIRHGYVNLRELDVYHMLIHRDFIEGCFGEFKRTVGFSLLFEVEPYLRAQYRENMFIILSEGELREIRSDTELLDECLGLEGADDYINAIAKKILSRLCLLITKRQGVEALKPKTNKELGIIAETLNFIHRSFAEKLTIDALAARANMSRSTFIRHFTEICGCPPHKYISDYRLKKATEQLRSSEKPFSTVSQECGFYDASHLRKTMNK